MKRGILLILAVSMLMTGCSQEPGEQRKEPGSFLRPGGDAVVNGCDALGQCH